MQSTLFISWIVKLIWDMQSIIRQRGKKPRKYVSNTCIYTVSKNLILLGPILCNWTLKSNCTFYKQRLFRSMIYWQSAVWISESKVIRQRLLQAIHEYNSQPFRKKLPFGMCQTAQKQWEKYLYLHRDIANDLCCFVFKFSCSNIQNAESNLVQALKYV